MSWRGYTVRATLHPVLPGRNLILHKLVSKLDWVILAELALSTECARAIVGRTIGEVGHS